MMGLPIWFWVCWAIALAICVALTLVAIWKTP